MFVFYEQLIQQQHQKWTKVSCCTWHNEIWSIFKLEYFPSLNRQRPPWAHVCVFFLSDCHFGDHLKLCLDILPIISLSFKTQIKGKESENSYQELKRSQKRQAHTNTWKLKRDISTGTAVFLNRKRVNVCEHTTKTASLESLRKVPPGGCERDGWREIFWD